MTMPAIFFGHGNPMNAIRENAYTRAWAKIGASLPRPKAVLAVSAHWFVPSTSVTAMAHPRTIHDFGGFPPELHAVRYAAPGAPDLAARVKTLLAPMPVSLDTQWGLDHGTWSVLCHVYPDADIPVVQLSIDERQGGAFHYEVGKRLATLRDEGVLLVGSGNIVHNLRAFAWGDRPAAPFDWAVRFETQAREFMMTGEHAALIDYESLGRDATLSAPTPEHYLPLLYVLGAQRPADVVTFPVDGIDGGSISMLSVHVGAPG